MSGVPPALTPAPALPSPLDFAGPGRPLLRAFRSIAIVLERMPGPAAALGPDVAALADWIIRWDNWFRLAAGMDRGNGLHLQYRRDAVVVTDLDFADLLTARPIGEACRTAGIGFGAPVLMSAAIAHRGELVSVLGEGWLQALTLVHDLPAGDAGALVPFVEEIFSTGLQVQLAGNPADFLRSGLLDSPLLNARNVTINPRNPGAPEAPSLRPQPCLPLMRLYVDSTGRLYPCLGMLGLEAGCLGHIDDALEDTVLGGLPSPLDLAELAVAGPVLTGDDLPARHLGLPTACERHRSAIGA
ncbi:hypothetical protein [Arenibaculum sp.]|uniref:hypothetical protein n=1 Tax=Arenibaculum sp. TaxID=2865862 RepID=UPI002E0EDD2E|nr:hypothetical protein [Arenibaculum sp.]